MKQLLTILLVVCFCATANAGGTMYLKGTDTFIISHGVPDSAGLAYTPADSVQITVMFQDGTESLAAAWFNNADAQAVLSNSKLYFFDAWTDMNGSDSLGMYVVTANWYDGSAAALPFEETYTVIQITNNVEASTAAAVAAAADVVNIDAWDPILDNDSLIIDQSSLEDIAINLDNATNTLSNAQIDDDVDINVKTVTANAIGDGDIATDAIGANELNADAVDEFWEADTSTMSAAQGIGTIAKDATDLIIAGLDVNVASVDADAIEAGDMKTGAIDADAIATDAIGQLEIATDAISTSEVKDGFITAAKIATNAIGNDELADDITLDSLHARTVVISNTGGTGLYIKNTGGHVVHLRNEGTATAALYADGSAGTHTHGIKAEGTGDGYDILADLYGTVTSVTGNVDGNVGGNITGSVASVTAAVVASDTVATGDTIAVKKDSTIYQGAAGALSAAGVWNYDISDFDDTTSNIRAGQYLFDVGLDGVSHTTPTLQMKLGDYSGAAGDDNNIKEDIDAISAASGGGPRLCSLFVSDANDKAITDGETRMTSGATTYTANVSGDGFAVYSLTDATWQGLVYSTGYVQDTIPQSFTVSASFKDTLTMTVVSIANPSAADKVTCYIDTYNIMGAAVENATLTATVNDNGPWFAVDDSSAIMVPETVSARTNSSGRATIELWESAEVRNKAGDNPTFTFILEKSRHFKWSAEDRSTPDADTWQIK